MSEIETRSPAGRMLTAAFALAMFGLGVAACGGDDGGGTTPPPAPDGGTPAAGPAVLAAERVFAPDNTRSYFVSVLASAPTTTALDRTKALELTSADIEVFGGKVYIRDRVQNTMTRYSVSADLKLVKETQFSFANLGLGTGRYSSVYLSANRALLMDSTNWKLIGWDPTQMQLTGENVSIANMSHAEFTTATGQISPATKVGDKWIAAIYWEDLKAFVLYPGSGVMVIDPAAPVGTVPQFIEDSRLGGAFRVTADGGDAYVTGVSDGAARLFGKVYDDGKGTPMPDSGVLKLPAGAGAFDPDYFVDLEKITASKTVWAVHRVSNQELLVQVFDPNTAVPAAPTAYASSTDFIFGTVDTTAGTFAAVTAPGRGGRASAGNYTLDGTLYIQTTDADSNSQTFAVTPDGKVTQAFPVASGDLWQLARIR